MWQLTNGRTWVDGNVQSFALGNDGYDYVLGTNGNLWKELPGRKTYGRTWVDGNVQSFARGSDGYDYVLGTDGNLWQELPGWKTYGRTWVDGNVRSFAHGSDGYDYVLGTDLNLWQELPGWKSNGRTWVDGRIRSFSHGSDGYDYVVGTDGNVWQEQPGWRFWGRIWVDGTARNFALGNDVATYVLDPRPAAATAYSPASGTLFGQNGPSYLDVQQGAEADCWLMASLAATAARVPTDITSMFTYDGTAVENGSQVGVYTVRFYDSNGTAQYVTVDTELPSGGSYYDRPVNGVLWAALAEKAYAVANGYGFVTGRIANSNDYDALGNKADSQGRAGGIAAWALQAITGQAAGSYNLDPNGVVNAWNAGQLVVLCTPQTPGPYASPYIVSWHCYALVNYNPSNSYPFLIFNPWGKDPNDYWAPGHYGTTYGLFMANTNGLLHNFSEQDFGSGAAPDGHGAATELLEASSIDVGKPPAGSNEFISAPSLGSLSVGQAAWTTVVPDAHPPVPILGLSHLDFALPRSHKQKPDLAPSETDEFTDLVVLHAVNPQPLPPRQ
jgi:hypothetical protein